jgi:AAHS family 4-hydroxybenzoate transporter-like MFS transporter
MATVFGVGFCVIGSQTAANAVAALAYPTAIRSTGVSWAIGIGRIGSIVGPIVGGLLLSLHLPSTTLFLIGAVPALGASLCAFFFSRVVRNAARDDVVIEVAEATA